LTFGVFFKKSDTLMYLSTDLRFEILKHLVCTRETILNLLLVSKEFRTSVLLFCDMRLVQQSMMIHLICKGIYLIKTVLILDNCVVLEPLSKNPTINLGFAILKSERINNKIFRPGPNILIRLASTFGAIRSLPLLVQDPSVDPQAESDQPIRNACKSGNIDVVRLLLLYAPPTDDALSQAIVGGHTELIQLLLQDQRINPDRALEEACTQGNLEIVRLCLQIKQSPRILYCIEELMQSCRGPEFIEVAVEMLNGTDTKTHQWVLDAACRLKQSDMVRRLLGLLPFTESVQNIVANYAVEAELEEIVEKMLQGPKVSSNWLYFARSAKTLKRLLRDPRIDPSQAVLNQIADEGNWELADLLLQHPKLRSTENNVMVFQTAAKRGHVRIVHKLLPLVSAKAKNEALFKSVFWGGEEVVRLLLQDSSVDPSLDGCKVVLEANKKGYSSIVNMFLKDPRVDPDIIKCFTR
jgi:hypothetical protein